MSAIAPGTQLGNYTVESILGEGGMAIVYRVTHNTLGTSNALKVLRLPTESIQKRLEQEGKVQAILRHPNIVAVTDMVSVHGSPGLIMEYVEGLSLEDLIIQHPLSVEQADLLATGILEGVAYAHGHGTIHRDLKPANILIDSSKKGLLTPKITDFGLAKLLSVGGGTGNTHSGMTMGTPSYMAPEQIRDAKNVDERADVFSLGAILYELYTGQQCFQGDIVTVFSSIAAQAYPHPRELKPGLPDRVYAAVEGALKANRDERIQSADALLDVLRGGKLTVETPWGDLLDHMPSSDRIKLADRSVITGISADHTWAGTPSHRKRRVAQLDISGGSSGGGAVAELPTLMRTSDPVPEELHGSIAPVSQTLLPSSEDYDEDFPEWPPRRSTAATVALWGGLGVAVMAVLILLAFGGLSLVVGFGGEPTEPTLVDPVLPVIPAPVDVVEPEPVVVPEPEPDPSSRPSPRPVQPHVAPRPMPAPVVVPMPEPDPEPVLTVVPPPAPVAQPPPPPSGRLVLDPSSNDFKALKFTNESDGTVIRRGASEVSGSIPVGRYTVVAYFGRNEEEKVLSNMQVNEGSVWSVLCQGGMSNCLIVEEP
jgi:serine/threonine protein kinase